MILEDFFNQYYWPMKQATLRKCTLEGYACSWRLYVQPRFGSYEMKDILTRDIELWMMTIEKSGAARKAWHLLRPILKMAVRYELLEKDPTINVEYRPPKPKYTPEVYTPEELNLIIQEIKGTDLEPWFLVACSTGLRKEEGAALLWEDINLKTGAVRITKGAQWVQGEEIIVKPKTELSDRTVYIPSKILARLREIAEEQHPTGRICGRHHAGQIGRVFKRFCEKKELYYIQPKNLRHTWATIALNEGVPISIVSKNLGHCDIATTAKYYLAPRQEDLMKASKIYNGIFD